MNISLNWLNDYFDIDIDIDTISKTLTDIGLEVEKVVEIEQIKGMLDGVIVGEVISKVKHNNADKLNITEVNIGKEKLLKIICGATNVEKGQKVMVATIGTKLYSNENEFFAIKKSNIRGEDSFGMICSEKELNISNNADGIMVLDKNANIGAKASDYLKLKKDYVFEIGLTPNRADAMSHLGVARDLLVALKYHNRIDENTKLNLFDESIVNNKCKNDNINIEIVDNESCIRYAGVVISNIEVKESPDWLKTRISSIGLKPKNNIVDITNYILHDLGQPLHAFDYDKIYSKKIKVKKNFNQKFTTLLDNREIELYKDDLIICDDKTPMCVAGVVGDNYHGITENTKNIFIESAYFEPSSIRKTAKANQISTDSSFRFERGIDPNITILALKKAISLVLELTKGEVNSKIYDIYPNKIEKKLIDFDINKCNMLIGKSIEKYKILKILNYLEIEIVEDNNEKLLLSIPSYRNDITRNADIVEEILRIYGYNNIELPEKISSSITNEDKLNKYKIQKILSDFLSSNGFFETMSNSLISKNILDDNENFVELKNPLSNEMNVLQTNLLHNALKNVSNTYNKKYNLIKFFEFAKTYHFDADNKYKENEQLILIATGKINSESWHNSSREYDFFDMKKILFELVNRFTNTSNYSLTENSNPKMQLSIILNVNNTKIAEFGILKNKFVKDTYDLKNQVYIASINIDNFIQLQNQNKKVKDISKFPTIRRDISLLLNDTVRFEEIKQEILLIEKKLIKEINIFDIYKGNKLPDNKKSYSIKLIFGSNEKTLSDTEIEKIMSKIHNILTQKFDAQLR